MGTSSSSSGPKGSSSLLPSWAPGIEVNDPSEEGDSDDQNDGSENSEEGQNTDRTPSDIITLTSAKSSLTRVANNTTGSSFRKAASKYIKGLGGSRNATRSSAVGIGTGAGYASFWNSVSNSGLDQTLVDYGLSDCIGKSSEEVFAKIADKIAPIGSTNDEAIARVAVMVALDKLYEKVLEENKDIQSLDSLDNEMLTETVIEFVSAYIFQKWVYEVGLALERNDLTEDQAVHLEKEMRSFIDDEVRVGIKDMDISKVDFQSGQGGKIIEDIFDLAYTTLE